MIYVKHDRYEELILLKERLEEQYRLRTGWQVCRMAFDFNPVISY